MSKSTMKLAAALFAGGLFASAAYADPVALNDTQLDAVAAGSFVCPVIKTSAVTNSPLGGPISGGFYTIGAPGGAGDITVPMHATNADGAGSPGGFHASPGDTNYTAIWYQ
jgi:hypothetical protein